MPISQALQIVVFATERKGSARVCRIGFRTQLLRRTKIDTVTCQVSLFSYCNRKRRDTDGLRTNTSSCADRDGYRSS